MSSKVMQDTQRVLDSENLPEVQESGLSCQEVNDAIVRGEVNVSSKQTSRSILDIIRANVFTLFNAIIFAAMIVVLATGSLNDAVFGFVIIINTGIGIVSELKAKTTLDRLAILVASRSIVRRESKNISIDHEQIVRNDLLWVRSGEQVPADVRVIHSWGLEMDESMLTGESTTVKKHDGEFVYSGSTVVSGMALTQVEAVGEHSYVARLSAQAKVYTKTVSDLSRGINTILKWMTVVVVPLCILLVWSQMRAVGGWQIAIATGAWRHAVVSVVAGVVGMIPEGLVLLTSLNFAVAATRLARHQTLVQELESVETLARVDCLNLDKTGTITDGTIVFNDLDILDDHSRSEVHQALFNLAHEEHPNATGNAIMQALVLQGVQATSVLARVPFSSQRKWSAIITQDTTDAHRGAVWYMGAPEVLSRALDENCASILNQVETHASQGERVLMLICAQLNEPHALDTQTMTILPEAKPVALVRCSEHIRDDAHATLEWFRQQGVRARVISGDNPSTVAAVANKVGLTGNRKAVAMDARKLPSDIHELARVLEDVDVLGRVLPEQKKAIVQALHTQNHVVAMTGDGVNDTLALKEADLGIAMGNAAGAAKAVAQIVLVDSCFSHLPDVVARGRQVMANMERVAGLFLVKTVYSVLISFGVILLGLHFPYLPRHITYIGSLTIGIPAFLLALAPNTRRYIPGFLKRVIRFAVPSGIAIGLCVLLNAYYLPRVMHWQITQGSEYLIISRITCAMIVFVLGILVLSRVARPLRSWRGIMVACFVLAGVIGLCIPFVAKFFMLSLPTGPMIVVTLIVLLLAVAIYTVLVLMSYGITRYFERKHKVLQTE